MASQPRKDTNKTLRLTLASPPNPASPFERKSFLPSKRALHEWLTKVEALDEDSIGWISTFLSYIALTIMAAFAEHYGKIYTQPLLQLFFALTLLAAIFPASGPRGQRIALLPGVGMAMCVLLPPITATLPVLLANALYAGSRDTPSARRGVLGRGVWLVLASLTASLVGWIVMHGHTRPLDSNAHITASLWKTVVYAATYVAGRQVGLRRDVASVALWSRSWISGRLEAAGLIACIPVALLMQLVYPKFGVSGVALSAGLMGLLLLIAHFGFEVALLREQVRAMEKISLVTLSQTNPNKVIERFLQLSTSLIVCDRAALWLTDNSQTRLERVSIRHPDLSIQTVETGTFGGDAISLRFGEGLVGRVADRKQPLLVRGGNRNPRIAEAERSGKSGRCNSLLLLPLVAGGETVGVAQFERENPGIFSPRDLIRVRSLSSQVSATISNIRMHRDIYNQAVTDGLTGLFNRRHMQTALLDERQRAARYGHALSVIMLDVDDFKSYNDTYGHPQGDVLLKKLATALRESVRETDVVGRYGGEEFIIIMPETAKHEAWLTAERVRTAVATSIFPGYAEKPEMVVFKTISLGVATYPQDTDDIQTLVSLADQALYRAKRAGRNQVIQASVKEFESQPLITTPEIEHITN